VNCDADRTSLITKSNRYHEVFYLKLVEISGSYGRHHEDDSLVVLYKFTDVSFMLTALSLIALMMEAVITCETSDSFYKAT
jgi:hypothetical protein